MALSAPPPSCPLWYQSQPSTAGHCCRGTAVCERRGQSHPSRLEWTSRTGQPGSAPRSWQRQHRRHRKARSRCLRQTPQGEGERQMLLVPSTARVRDRGGRRPQAVCPQADTAQCGIPPTSALTLRLPALLSTVGHRWCLSCTFLPTVATKQNVFYLLNRGPAINGNLYFRYKHLFFPF